MSGFFGIGRDGFNRANALVRLAWAVAIISGVGCSSGGRSTPDGGGGGNSAAVSESGGGAGGFVGSGTGSGGVAGAPADAASGDSGAGDAPSGTCGAGSSTTTGWVDIQASVSGLGSGLMTSPILRCERGGGRLAVLAAGTERDGIDYTVMRIEIAAGFAGPGVYSGSAQAVQVDVYHDDVGGFSVGGAGHCEVCIGADGQSGSFTCTAMPSWSGSDTMDVTSGGFACPSAPTVEPTVMGGNCSLYACPGSVSAAGQSCAVPQPRCAGGVCVTGFTSLSGICSRACDGAGCPSGWRCDAVSGHPARVCVNAAVCGNGIVEMGETCDEPLPTDRCADACVNCRPTKRPGAVKIDAQAGNQHMSLDLFPPNGTIDCFRSVGRNSDGTLTLVIPSCDPAQDFSLFGVIRRSLGVSPLDGTTYLCVARPRGDNYSVDRVVYCALQATPPAAGESGSVTVTEALCDKGDGAGPAGVRGSLTAHMVYQYTMQASTDEHVKDPTHAGETLDVNATFELIASSL